MEHPKRSRTRAGLTLIEMVIFLTILGILATVVIFATTGSSQKPLLGSITEVALTQSPSTLTASWHQTNGPKSRYFIAKAGHHSCITSRSASSPYHRSITDLTSGTTYKLQIWGMGSSGQSTNVWSNYVVSQ